MKCNKYRPNGWQPWASLMTVIYNSPSLLVLNRWALPWCYFCVNSVKLYFHIWYFPSWFPWMFLVRLCWCFSVWSLFFMFLCVPSYSDCCGCVLIYILQPCQVMPRQWQVRRSFLYWHFSVKVRCIAMCGIPGCQRMKPGGLRRYGFLSLVLSQVCFVSSVNTSFMNVWDFNIGTDVYIHSTGFHHWPGTMLQKYSPHFRCAVGAWRQNEAMKDDLISSFLFVELIIDFSAFEISPE